MIGCLMDRHYCKGRPDQGGHNSGILMHTAVGTTPGTLQPNGLWQSNSDGSADNTGGTCNAARPEWNDPAL